MRLVRTSSLTLARGTAGRISFSGLCSIAAVLAVVIVVSVPRLGRIALAENDSDARTTARFLADTLADSTAEARIAPDLLELPAVRRTLTDARPVPGSAGALAYHGYRFDVVAVPAAWPQDADSGEVAEGRWAVLARPDATGEGLGRTYLARPDGATFALAPGALEDDPRAWRRVD